MISFVSSNKHIIVKALYDCKWNVTYAAEKLGIPKRTLTNYVRYLRQAGYAIPRTKVRKRTK